MNAPLSPRQPFKPIRPDSPCSMPGSPGHAKSGSVSKLRQHFDSPTSSPVRAAAAATTTAATSSSLTSTNLAHFQQQQENENTTTPFPQPIVPRAKVTAAAAPRRKQTVPGAERVSKPIHPAAAAAISAPSSSSSFSSIGSSTTTTTRSFPSQPSYMMSPPPPTLPSYTNSTAIDPFAAAAAFHDLIPEPVSSSHKDTVVVCVRVKPTAEPEKDAWAIDPNVAKVALTQSDRAGSNFNFDGVVTGSGNKAIYEAAARPLIRQAMQGFDAVVFAYGQTASGKTYTLTGTHANPGIIPQAVSDIFTYIRANPTQEFLLRASYLEIYNENLKDLLAPETQGLVKIRQDAQKRFFVAPLREEVVTSEAQVAALLLRGEANRHTGATDFNARSSRSHTILQIIIESREAADPMSRAATPIGKAAGVGPHQSRLAATGGGAVKISRLSLIDLAGSEKATSQSERRIEGAFINKSLLTLEKVVSALTEDKPRAHIPYRDSKLTQILQPSLAGTAKVAVICTFNPASNFVEESKSTLKFASRVKKVTVAAERNEVLDDKALLTKYRNQIAELQAQLAQKTAEAASIPPTPQRAPNDFQSRKNSSENKKQAETLRSQIAGLQELFLRAENVDRERNAAPAILSPVLNEDSSSTEQLSEQYQDATEKITDLEDQVAKLQATVSELRDELVSRPSVPRDAPTDVKDQKIEQLEKTIREMEVIIANTDVEDAARRERRLVEREWMNRVRVLERDILVRKELEAKANEVLANERKRSHELEQFIINHLNSEADKLSRRRSSCGSVATQGDGLLDVPVMPSLLDEPADLDTISASFATVSMNLAQLADGAGGDATPTKRMSSISEL